jgi:hypothetical protein
MIMTTEFKPGSKHPETVSSNGGTDAKYCSRYSYAIFKGRRVLPVCLTRHHWESFGNRAGSRTGKFYFIRQHCRW